jgi:hypothetical protein
VWLIVIIDAVVIAVLAVEHFRIEVHSSATTTTTTTTATTTTTTSTATSQVPGTFDVSGVERAAKPLEHAPGSVFG